MSDETEQTYLVRLWIDNDSGLLSDVMEAASNADSAYEMGQWIREYVDSMADSDLSPPSGLFADLFDSAMHAVDWTALGLDYFTRESDAS